MLPVFEIPIKDLEEGVDILDLCVTVGFCKSRTEARKAVRNRAIRVNDVIIEDEKYKLRWHPT